MAAIETLGILEEIHSLVSDRFQVVSYKWLSRNFLVSSNVAKKLLEEFVGKHSEELEVIYTVAGWIKNTPSTYRIQLVPQPKLSEAKEYFGEDCSIQVYSVQASIPEDPALLWNPEFVQAEELFKQPAAVENCLRDNRFCGVLNSSVKRNSTGIPTSLAAPQAKNVGSSANNSNSSTQGQQRKQSSTELIPNSSGVDIPGRGKCKNSGSLNLDIKSDSDNGKSSFLAGGKNKGQSDKISTGSGGSIAKFWCRASSKSSKSLDAPVEAKNVVQQINVNSEGQIAARETLEHGNSEDDGEDVNFKRLSTGDNVKKRRVIIDDSDDEDGFEDVVNLASPDPPVEKLIVSTNLSSRTCSGGSKSLNLEDEEEHPKVEEDKLTDKALNRPIERDPSSVNEIQDSKIVFSDEINDVSKKSTVASSSPKRRKVLRTRIDERGREVTEVVWEGEDEGNKQSTDGATKTLQNERKKPVDKASAHPANRGPAAKKSSATGNSVSAQPSGKAGNKKSAKDHKQGNLMSFFKKV